MTDTATTVTPAAMEQLFSDYGDAWASHDADAIASHHAEDGIFHLHSGGEGIRGRDAIRDTFAGFLGQFPDLRFDEQQKMVEDWGWVVRWTMSGTLAQPYPAGSKVAQPGSRFEIDALDMITVADGKLTAKHTYLDWQAALDQLGLS